ncbi:MAG: LysM domain-containing protein [Desulfosalsimonadaceae bacterium]
MHGKIKVISWLAGVFILFSLTTAPAGAGIEEHIKKTETGFYYTVQKGDTLWDLSEKFEDSPWQWPELWHYNPEIANPHWIYPGQKILIYKKQWAEKQKKEKTPEKKEEKKTLYHYEMIDSVGFIRNQAVTPCGTVFKVKDDKELVSEGDRVYIYKGEGPELRAGELYTVYRTFESQKRAFRNTTPGIQHYLTGVVAVTDTEPEYVIANVVKAFRDIHADDHVMPLVARSPDIEIKESVPGLSGEVLLSEEKNAMIGQKKVLFINKGRQDGVKRGQYYEILHQPVGKPEEHKGEIALKPYSIGRLLVLHVEQSTASCLTTESRKAIAPGDKIRSPQ